MKHGKLVQLLFLTALLITCVVMGCASNNPTDTGTTVSEGTNSMSDIDTSTMENSSMEPNTTIPNASSESPTEASSTEGTGYISESDTSVEPVRTISEIKESLSEDDLTCDAYDMEKYLLPYWTGNIVYNESLTFYKDKGGKASAPLLYDVAEIISVKSSDFRITYQEGVDYILDDGKLVLTENSSIPCFSYNEIYFSQERSGASWALKKGGYTLFQEGTFFHQHQVAVTYLHTQPWKGYKPAYQGSMLPKIIEKLKKGEEVTIVYLGDSIVKGGNASGMFNQAPNMPIWTEMVTAALKKAYPDAKIFTYSASENGATTVQAIKNLRQLCSNYKPDLVIIGFGMNDGSDSAITPERFKSNIQTIMETNDLLTGKSCDYLLLSTTLPNQEVKLGDANNQGQLADKLFELEKRGTLTTGGVVVGDMTAIHLYLLQSKRFIDMTANNINHPNDFLIRAYAQLICTMLIE